MRTVAEIIHIAPEERDKFLQESLHPTEETLKVLWHCGVRNQQYYGTSNLIFMSFAYVGSNFREDMARMSAYLESIGHLVTRRRREVPPAERSHVSWWAPVKKLGQVDPSTFAVSSWENDCCGPTPHSLADISYDEQDWVDDFHF